MKDHDKVRGLASLYPLWDGCTVLSLGVTLNGEHKSM